MAQAVSAAWQEAVGERILEVEKAFKETYGKNTQMPIHQLIDLSDYSQFHTSLGQITTEYENRTGSRTLREKIYPGLHHIQRLSKALSAVTQAQSIAAASFGALLLVVHCACTFTEHLEEIASHLKDLDNLIPQVIYDMNLYKEYASRFENTLRQVFIDYLDFCITIIRWAQHRPVVNVLRNAVSSRLGKKLKDVKARLKTHTEMFKRTAENIQKEQTNYLYNDAKQPLSTPEFPLFSTPLRNELFVGSSLELDRMHSCLVDEPHASNVTCCAITGVAGVGKTDTALEYCYMHRADYDAIFWVSAESDLTLKNGFGELSRRLGLFSHDNPTNQDVQREVLAVKHWLQSNPSASWVLVFDNVNSYKDVRAYWPSEAQNRCSIIVTTQLMPMTTDTWAHHKIELERLNPEDGSKVLLNYLGMSDLATDDPTRALACQVSELHGGLPLLIALAAAVIEPNGNNLELWIEENKGRHLRLDQHYDGGAWNYDRPPTEIFDAALGRLASDSKELLFMLLFLSPDDIHEQLLLSDHKAGELSFLRRKDNIPRYRVMVAEITRGFRVKIEDDRGRRFLRIHRTVQDVLLDIIGQRYPEERNMAFKRVVKLLREKYPRPNKLMRPVGSITEPTLYLLPHILHVSDVFSTARPPLEGTREFAELLVDVGGMDLYDTGYLSETMTILEVAERIMESLNIPEHDRYRGNILTVRGMCGDQMGISKRSEMMQIREKCRRSREQWFKELPASSRDKDAEVLVYNSIMDAVCSAQHLNQFDIVAKMAGKCLAKYRKWGPETDKEWSYEYAKYYNHMAYVWLYLGNDQKACEYAERGYKCMALSDEATQMTTLFRADWACILFQTGQTIQAIKHQEEILKFRRETCGAQNLLTMESHMTLGIMYLKDEDLQKAKFHLDKLYPRSIEEWPIENTIRVNYYYGQLLAKLNPSSDQGALLCQNALLEAAAILKEHEPNFEFAALADEIMIDYMVAWELRLATPRAEVPDALFWEFDYNLVKKMTIPLLTGAVLVVAIFVYYILRYWR
ncbi:hypothetical protein F4679DRAFT_552083 [Xylaria curta]|nr:hypothetical protein F4679DRAFT_552083 [Xylaria curta]